MFHLGNGLFEQRELALEVGDGLFCLGEVRGGLCLFGGELFDPLGRGLKLFGGLFQLLVAGGLAADLVEERQKQDDQENEGNQMNYKV